MPFGRPANPETRKLLFPVRLPPTLIGKIERAASRRRISAGEEVRNALEAHYAAKEAAANSEEPAAPSIPALPTPPTSGSPFRSGAGGMLLKPGHKSL